MILVSAVIALDCFLSWSNYLPTGNTTIVTHDYSFKYLKVFTDLPTLKTQKKLCETLNQEPEKVVRNGILQKKSRDVPNFLLEGLSEEIMSTGSQAHITLKLEQ